MLMLAARERPNTAPSAEPAIRASADQTAGSLSEAIAHHRAESRRHTEAARQHRSQLRNLLQQRDQDMAQLRASGWSLGRIAARYRITKERVNQVLRALQPEADDGVVA